MQVPGERSTRPCCSLDKFIVPSLTAPGSLWQMLCAKVCALPGLILQLRDTVKSVRYWMQFAS